MTSAREETRAFASWLAQEYPETRVISFNVNRKPILFVPSWLLWVSLGSRPDQRQRDWLAYLQGIGHRVIVARGCEDAQWELAKLVVAAAAEKC